ncbi:MAG: Gfo/Idh/MocA family oxidoreductase [Candidatus Neomarinimicrobiota bacterium]
MDKKIRVGVIGTSWWADRMYLPALRSHPQADISAICGRNRERTEAMAAKYNISRIFTDYEEMINQGGLDAIIVGTPDDLHYEITLLCLSAGLHVLCDKPLALRAQQALEMYERAEQVGVKHMILFTYRWMPFFRYVRDLIDQGYIGKCYHCEFRYVVGYGLKKEYKWRLDQNRSNGVLGDLGSHMIDLAHWLVGDISKVSAQLGVFTDRPGIDGGRINPANDSAFLLTGFANGAHGMIHTSFVAHVADQGMQLQVRLYGEDGSLEINYPYPGPEAGAIVRGARSHEEQFQRLEVPRVYWANADPSEPFGIFTRQSVGCRLFIDAILENVAVTPTFYDGYKVQQVIEAAIDSNKSGRRVTINNPPDARI